MNDVNDVDTRRARAGSGNIVIGAMLVLTGVAVMLDRSGVWRLSNQWTLWPLILGGIGLARFLQTVPGQPKQGPPVPHRRGVAVARRGRVGVARGFVADRHHRPRPHRRAQWR